VACSAAAQEAVWLRRFLKHLNLTKNSGSPALIHCDSQSAIAFSKDPKFHSKGKHISIRYNYVRDVIEKGKLALQYIPTGEMLADPMTKPLTRDCFTRHVISLGLKPMYL
jgi:hypothetical protein